MIPEDQARQPETGDEPIESTTNENPVATTRRKALKQIAALFGLGAVFACAKHEALEAIFWDRPSLKRLVEKVDGTVPYTSYGGPLGSVDVPCEVNVSRETGLRQDAQLIKKDQLERIIQAMLEEEATLPERLAQAEPEEPYLEQSDFSSQPPGMRHLILRNQSHINDDAMPAIARLARLSESGPGLTKISLSGTGITDNGLRHLRDFGVLEYLDLSDTAVTLDGIIEHLGGMRIETLGVKGTGITLEDCWEHDQVLHPIVGRTCVTDDGEYPSQRPAETETEEIAENQ